MESPLTCVTSFGALIATELTKRWGKDSSMVTVDERRRSDRLWLTIPLRVEGVDSGDHAFEYSGHARTLSRHGARIHIPRLLDEGQIVRLKSPMGHFESEFIVVNCAATAGDDGGEYGLECVDENENFWGIEFPSIGESMIAEASGLLECRICHKLALLALTLSEVEALRTIGLVGKFCHNCMAISPWRYAEVRVPISRVSRPPAPDAGDPRAPWFVTAAESVERGHRRAYMQLPLSIRDSQGAVEASRTENVSRCGFCFLSERKYLAGEIVTVGWPLDSATQHIDLAARIVREEDIEGSRHKLYGATFEPPKCSAVAA